MLPDVMKARLGDRVGRMTMMRSLIAADVPVALGSDGPPNPYLNMMFAITNANNPAESDDSRTGARCLHHGIGVHRA